jgi:hypothetical protein
MGLLFNTPDTQQIIQKLNKRYDDKNNGLSANRGDYVVYLDFNGYPKLWDVAVKLQLYPGNNPNSMPARRWKYFLDFIDPIPDPFLSPSLGSTIGTILRKEIAKACQDSTNCQSIEFFAVPDTTIHLNLGNLGTPFAGKYSRIITLFTMTADQMGSP